MRKAFILLGLLVSLETIAQNISNHDSLPELSVVMQYDTTILGKYTCTNGFGGDRLTLHSNKKYEIMTFDCVSRSTIESGEWEFSSSAKMNLKSKKSIQIFQVIKFEDYYFLIPINKMTQFVEDFKRIKLLFNKRHVSFKVGKRTLTNKDLIATQLGNEYYLFDINEDAGS